MGGMVGPAQGGCFAGGESKRSGDIQPEELSGHAEGFWGHAVGWPHLNSKLGMRPNQTWGCKGNPRFIPVWQESAPEPKHHLKYRTEADFHCKAFSE